MHRPAPSSLSPGLIPFPSSSAEPPPSPSGSAPPQRARPYSFSASFPFRRPGSTAQTEVERALSTPLLSKRHVESAVAMARNAQDADEQGDRDFALDAFIHSLDFLLSALPSTSLPSSAQSSLRTRLEAHLTRLGIIPLPQPFPPQPTPPVQTLPPLSPTQRWQDRVIDAAVCTAVALKSSPLPYYALTLLRALIHFAAEADARFYLRARALDLVGALLDRLLWLNKEYELHRWCAEVGWTLWEAGVRSTIAFGQAEPYQPAPLEREPTAATATSTESAAAAPAPAALDPPPSYAASIKGLSGAAAGVVRARVFGR